MALNRLKLAAARHLPDYKSFFRFFGAANTAENVAAFKHYILPHLDPQTASYWQGRHGLRRRRRIKRFTSNFYRAGLLGTFIGASHLVARLNGVNPRMILKARTLEEQRRIFEQKFAPLFDRRALRWLVNRPASLYGLGIPPAQYKALAGDGEGGMANVLKKRLERLACGFPLSENYFAWQAFGRRYAPSGGPLPPYLDPANFAVGAEECAAGFGSPCFLHRLPCQRAGREPGPVRAPRCPGLDERRRSSHSSGRKSPGPPGPAHA